MEYYLCIEYQLFVHLVVLTLQASKLLLQLVDQFCSALSFFIYFIYSLFNPLTFLFQYFLKNNCVLLFQLLSSFLFLSIVLALLFYTLFNQNALIFYNFYYGVCVCVYRCTQQSMAVRGHLVGVGSLRSLCASGDQINHQTWRKGTFVY